MSYYGNEPDPDPYLHAGQIQLMCDTCGDPVWVLDVGNPYVVPVQCDRCASVEEMNRQVTAVLRAKKAGAA